MATTWRSPLSILMGARRNDDADLELRDDYFHPVSPSAAPSSSAVAPRTPNQNGADEQQQTPYSKRSKSSGMSSYLPFRYFGLTSPAPTPAKFSDCTDINNNNILNASSPVPPPRSFPPPIESQDECDTDDIGEPGGLDERQRNNSDNQQYSASHPWFNQLELTESGGNDNTYPNQYNNNEPHSTEKKNHITWSDQKSIIGTTFNFTNSIIGAGAMGLGGAFAASGGGVSVLMLIGFAYLTKQSLDLIVDLSSCPEVIQMARAKEAHEHHHDDNRLDDIEENDIADDESFASNEDQQQQPDDQEDKEPQEAKDDGNDQNSSSFNKGAKDGEDKGRADQENRRQNSHNRLF